MIVVHLACMRDHRYLVRLGDRVDLLRGGDAADPVGVILQDRDGLLLEKLRTAKKRIFMLATRDRDRPAVQLGIATKIIGNHRLFQPARLELLQLRDHPFRIIEVPAHIGLEHQVTLPADSLAHRLDPLQVLAHTCHTVARPVSKSRLESDIALLHGFLGLGLHAVDRAGIELGIIAGDLFLGASAEELEDRLAGKFAHQVPDGDVDGGDRRHADALAPPGMGATVHLLPDPGIVERILADHHRRVIFIDGLFHKRGRERRIADADGAVGGLHLAGQPLVEPE